jgi:hypothetical protein
MTTTSDNAVPTNVVLASSIGGATDHRGSWIPTLGMIRTRIMELRKRRGLMIALLFVNIGIPSIFLLIRLISHDVAPKSYGPAGGYQIFTNLVTGVMFIFGFIIAATLGCTAGSVDLSEGMFRHLVITGRSRLALYFARIPAGLAIIVPMVAAGFTIVCCVCVFAAPTKLSFDGVNVPANMTLTGLQGWAVQHPKEVVCGFEYRGPIDGVPCGINRDGKIVTPPGTPGFKSISTAKLDSDAVKIVTQDYGAYKDTFLTPSTSLMVKSGLWIELEAILGFVVGLGLASLMGQRTVPVVLMIILEVILTPLFSTSVIPHLINFQRSIVGVAMEHLEPGGLPKTFGGGGGGGSTLLIHESTTFTVIVVVAWIVGWTALGAWRMAKRDA